MKNELRKAMRKKIREFIDTFGVVYLPVGILQSCLPPDTKTLFAFLSTSHEISTASLIALALEKGITVAVPRVEGPSLSFCRITDSASPFEPGAFKIPEPGPDALQLYPRIDGNPDINFPLMIVVPGLAFTRKGERLGQGGGFYDRFLSAFLAEFADKRSLITLAGLCRDIQIVDSIPFEDHDVRLDCLITENGCILCT